MSDHITPVAIPQPGTFEQPSSGRLCAGHGA